MLVSDSPEGIRPVLNDMAGELMTYAAVIEALAVKLKHWPVKRFLEQAQQLDYLAEVLQDLEFPVSKLKGFL